MYNMRLHISGIGPNISTEELQDKFACAGRVLDVFRPEPRHLGDEVIHREFAFVEIAEEDREKAQKIVNVLKGSVWKGQKVRIAEARPDYKHRLHSEAASSESEVAQAGEPASSEDDDQQLEDVDAEEPCQVYRIRSPNGQVWTLPCSGTGNRKSLFMPARHLGTTNETGHHLDTHSSSLYHRNLMWQQMVEAQVQRPAPDPEVFSGASLPVPMEIATQAVRIPEAELAQAADQPVKQPSEADRAREIMSRYVKLNTADLEAGNDSTAVAVAFSDDEAGAPPAMLHQRSGHHPPPHALQYHSSSEDDGEQHTLDGTAIDTSVSAVVERPEALLVALSVERGRKHILSVGDAADDGADALRIEEGEDKLSLRRISAGVDMLGGFDGHGDIAEDVKRGEDDAGQVSSSADDGSDSEGEAELLRTLLAENSAAAGGEHAAASSSGDEDNVSGSGGGFQSASEQEESAARSSSTSSEQLESDGSDGCSRGESGDEEEGEQGGGDGEQADGSFSSGAGVSEARGEAAAAQQAGQEAVIEDDAWAAAFRLAAGGAEEPGSDVDADVSMEDGEGEGEGEEEGGAGQQDDAQAGGAAAMDTDTAAQVVTEPQAVPTAPKRARPVAEARAPGQDGSVSRRVAVPGGAGPSELHGADVGGGWEAEEEEAGGQDSDDNDDDMQSDGDLEAQMQELQQEMMLQQKATKVSSKRQRGGAQREARKQRRMSAASKGEEGGSEADPAPPKPKTALAQIFREQKQLAEDIQHPQSAMPTAGDAAPSQRTHTAATQALFAHLPFHRASSAPKDPAESPAVGLKESMSATKRRGVELQTADSFVRKFAGSCVSGEGSEDGGARFVRCEDLAVLEGRLKVSRPGLLADMKSKLRMHMRRKQAEKDLFKKKPKK